MAVASLLACRRRRFYAPPVSSAPDPRSTRQDRRPPRSTIDGDFIARHFSADEVHVVDDSTELTVFEMSSSAQAVGRPVAPLSASAVGRWAACNADEGHMGYSNAPVTFRTGKPSSAWQAAHDSLSDLEGDSPLPKTASAGGANGQPPAAGGTTRQTVPAFAGATLSRS